MHAVRFDLLGPVRGYVGGVETPLGARQQLAFLTTLLVAGGRTVPVDQLVDGIWSEDPPARAIGVIRTYASRLRGQLAGSGVDIIHRAGGYAATVPAGALDLDEFEEHVAAGRLSAALALHRGEPLAGVPGPLAERHRARLLERIGQVVEARIDADLAAGRGADVIVELTALIAEQPLRERWRGQLMTALYQSGRQSDALAVYADARRILTEELGCEPGPELREVHRQILTEEMVVAPRGAAPRPAQLPAAPTDLTGRDAVIGALAGRTPPIVALTGPGGVGKTAVALTLAHHWRNRYPDGQLHVDLRGVDADPRDPADVLADFLRALGAEVPDGLPGRAALYRSMLADRELLVVLDNARDLAQVTPLLPGAAGSSVLITSRTALDGLAGAEAVELTALSRSSSVDLLARIVGPGRIAAEPDAADAVAAACGGLPLALRLAGARLAKRPGWSVAALSERLADESGRLDQLRAGDFTVEAAFALSYRQLDQESARAFRLLAVAPAGLVSLAAAAALLDRPARAADELLESLVDCGLLRTPAAGQYDYHDLLRLYARKCGKYEDSPAERAAALDRLLAHYLDEPGAEAAHRGGPHRAGLLIKR
ncbi:AfsR/SARP family transcriptional regulator [Longispora fulva]|uniref:AfsR/SARP family transcriptional regulator n=1 Tax=Longispora fulva TaxID=619741 RepID=UPI003641C12E